MKKMLQINAGLLTALLLVIVFNAADAQSKNEMKLISSTSLQAPDPPAVAFAITVPDEYASHIIRENGDHAVYFQFKKSDGTTVFLFQVNKTEEAQWIKIKNQLSNPTVLAHKNGYIYYALTTDKSRIKGADNEAYEQIYGRLHQMVGTIVITE